MYSYHSFYDLNVLLRDYQNKNFEVFKENFNKIFNVSSQMADEQLVVVEEILEENISNHNYISQILMEQVADIKRSPELTKVENLLGELDFAKIAYREDFERDSAEIDDVENMLLEWSRLVKINKQLSLFLFTQKSYDKDIMELILCTKELLDSNISKLKDPLKDLYHNRQESLKLYNSISQMRRNAKNIYKNYE